MPRGMYSYAYHENNCLEDVYNVGSKDHVTTWVSKEGRNDMNTLILAMWKHTQRKITRKKTCHWLIPQNGRHGKLLYLKLGCALVSFVMKKYLITGGNYNGDLESRLF